jgi:hypothetical protein
MGAKFSAQATLSSPMMFSNLKLHILILLLALSVATVHAVRFDVNKRQGMLCNIY